MNADTILETFNRCGVDCLLIGGMNFLLRHQPVLTYDMLACQLALPEAERKLDRIRLLRQCLQAGARP